MSEEPTNEELKSAYVRSEMRRRINKMIDTALYAIAVERGHLYDVALGTTSRGTIAAREYLRSMFEKDTRITVSPSQGKTFTAGETISLQLPRI